VKHPIPFRTRKVNPHVALLVLFDTGEEVKVKKKEKVYCKTEKTDGVARKESESESDSESESESESVSEL
jgi:hypothetical protein